MKIFLMLLIAISLNLILFLSSVKADTDKTLSGSVSDPFVEAQEKLLNAKGSYKVVKMQEQAIKDMRNATRLSLKASKLRARAERLQNKADMLINKANQHAISRGLYITNPNAGIMMEPPPEAQEQTAKNPKVVPVPGQSINIIVPKQEEVTYEDPNNGYSNNAPLNSF